MRGFVATVVATALVAGAGDAAAQSFPSRDTVIQRIWRLGMEESHTWELAQALMDSIGPRLTGSPGQKAGNDWLVKKYREWGIPARNEQYGTWTGWRRGPTHIDLVAPRVRTLEGMMLAWSPGTNGPVEGEVAMLPELADARALAAWLPQVRGKFVAIDFPQPTCRPDRQWEEFAAPGSFERMKAARDSASDAFRARISNTGLNVAELRLRLENAGALGILQSRWSGDYGVNKIFGTNTQRIPTLDLSCEDYGLVARMAQQEQGPRLRVDAQSTSLGAVPVFNTIAEIRGSEKPDEYVMLSAHFDSWDGSSGATDNGTGTITMLEAMRILKLAYPSPKRTILVGHWSGEEQGLNGSRAFAHDHPEVVEGLQTLLNQDNGTGRIVRISMQGLTDAGAFFGRWFADVPTELTGDIELNIPGTPGGGGSDYASFICYGAPAFSLSALSWGYGTYTWHTNRDTFDKIVFDDLRRNATLAAMLAYLASEDPERMPRDRRVLPEREGEQMTWPECRDGERMAPEVAR